MDDRVHVLGVRHHGPGSAASVERALEALAPACVLIEGPPEADDIAHHAADAGMHPPVAILVHEKDRPDTSRLFPFAHFSPEWRALLWALRNQRPVHFIDLPNPARPEEDEGEAEKGRPSDDDASQDAPGSEAGGTEDAEPVEPVDAPDADADADEAPAPYPLDYLADLAGFSDGEAWWNAQVEQHVHAPAVFAAIHDAMAALREEGFPVGERDALREAHMRLRIRDALKRHEGEIAVVCGAWHAPALTAKSVLKADRALLKGFRKARVECCWVPWTHQRLARESGYGAGVVSPGWYAHLWRQFDAPDADGTARWQIDAARALRDAGHSASTASAIEATRLATALASLRGQPVVGLAEMRDATRAALCHGEEALALLVDRQLVVGDALGRVSESAPQPPLLRDLERAQRRLRMPPKAEAQDTSMDLRTPTGMARSVLLHRLILLEVPWGTLLDGAAGRGTFREQWRLEWAPELSVRLADAAIWGATIEEAARNRATSEVADEVDTDQLAERIRLCLLAELPSAAEAGLSRLQSVAVTATNLRSLMHAVVPLADVMRYGTARRMPVAALRSLLRVLTIEICTGLAWYCRQLDAEEAALTREAVGAFDRAVRLLDEADLLERWMEALARVGDDEASAPLVGGLAVRILYDQGEMDPATMTTRLSRALSPAVPALQAGSWLEGFLGTSGDVLLHDEALLGAVDTWLCERDGQDFIEVLPMLRRAFSAFDSTLRQRLLRAVTRHAHASVTTAPTGETTSPAYERALPLLRTILGLAP